MGVGSGLNMYDDVVKRSRSVSHLLMSSCYYSVYAYIFEGLMLSSFSAFESC